MTLPSESCRIAREREMLLTLPIALRTLAEARIAAADPRATETLDEAAKFAAQLGYAYEAGGDGSSSCEAQSELEPEDSGARSVLEKLRRRRAPTGPRLRGLRPAR